MKFLRELLFKLRQVVGAAMLAAGLPALAAGVMVLRSSHGGMMYLGAVYCLGGAYLTYEGLVLLIGKRQQ